MTCVDIESDNIIKEMIDDNNVKRRHISKLYNWDNSKTILMGKYPRRLVCEKYKVY